MGIARIVDLDTGCRKMNERIIKFYSVKDIVQQLSKRERNELAMAIYLETDNELYALEKQ